jgi:hypothetical protein
VLNQVCLAEKLLERGGQFGLDVAGVQVLSSRRG